MLTKRQKPRPWSCACRGVYYNYFARNNEFQKYFFLMLMSQYPFSETEFFWLFIACFSWEFTLRFPWTLCRYLMNHCVGGSSYMRRVEAESRPARNPDSCLMVLRVMQQKCLMSSDDMQRSGQWATLESQDRGFDQGGEFWPKIPCNITLLLPLDTKVTIFEIAFLHYWQIEMNQKSFYNWI